MPRISLDPTEADQTAAVFATARERLEHNLSVMASANERVMETWHG